jgi:NAD(P)-dependent dehydrogenase (short-subunit alcohol dehydrogenase family)
MTIPSESHCLVVGATNPTCIGYRTALTLLQAGVRHVTIMGRDQEKLDQAVSLLSSEDGVVGKVSGVVGDLKKPESMKAVVTEACQKMDGKMDCLVCCGGNGYSEYLGLDIDDLESYRMMQNVAVLSPMVLAETAFPFLSRSNNPNGGTIVMVGSVSGMFALNIVYTFLRFLFYSPNNGPQLFSWMMLQLESLGPTLPPITLPWRGRIP